MRVEFTPRSKAKLIRMLGSPQAYVRFLSFCRETLAYVPDNDLNWFGRRRGKSSDTAAKEKLVASIARAGVELSRLLDELGEKSAINWGIAELDHGSLEADARAARWHQMRTDLRLLASNAKRRSAAQPARRRGRPLEPGIWILIWHLRHHLRQEGINWSQRDAAAKVLQELFHAIGIERSAKAAIQTFEAEQAHEDALTAERHAQTVRLLAKWQAEIEAEVNIENEKPRAL